MVVVTVVVVVDGGVGVQQQVEQSLVEKTHAPTELPQ
jgi:hypothetical protein